MNRSHRTSVAAVIALVVTAAACGSDDDTADTAADTADPLPTPPRGRHGAAPAERSAAASVGVGLERDRGRHFDRSTR
jgi:hypothetical protein